MAFNLKDDPRMLQRLKNAAVLASPKDIDAPAAEIPLLSGLVVHVPAPGGPTDEDIVMRYRDKVRDIATVTPRKSGDEIQLGDEVLLSMVGFANGALVPGSIRHQDWIEIVPDSSLPGFCEQLVGAVVGGATVVPVLLPLDFPEPSLRGKPAAITVRLHEAQAVEMPHPEADATVAAIGLGATLEQTLHNIGLELLAEAESASPLMAMTAVMHALAQAAVVEVPRSAVEAEIARTWKVAEGDACVALGLSVEEQQEALKIWLGNSAIREEATLRMKAWAALKAVVLRDELLPSSQGWQRFAEAFAPAMGTTAAELTREAEKDDKVFADLKEIAFQMQVVDHVMAQADIRVDGE